MAKYEPHDKYYRKAREQGLPSRAAFKIEELIARIKLPPDARVVDLGCAPGGWLAVLAKTLRNGRVIGIDLAPCKSFGPNVETVVADIRDPALPDIIVEKLGRDADLVTSDLAPKLTGIRERDNAQFEELFDAALAIAAKTLKPGGMMIAKLFMSGSFKEIVARFEQHFAAVEVTKVKATRPGSSELYLIARGFR
ncbi:MAG TPA: RlmE family RNA methyltransferase [Candidatus Binataceae bacterium]|nr:RlmE family RNA methyltransferase [Candidatus Binataceae bacterium]